MNLTMDKNSVILECFYNGHRRLLPFDDALRLFWQVDFAWLTPTDFYRYSLNGRAGHGYVLRAIKRAPRVMAYHLMRRGNRGLTLDDLRGLDDRSPFIGTDAFYARMARLNSGLFHHHLPAEMRPFEFTEVFNGNLKPIPAYRLNPDRSILLIKGIAGDSPGGFLADAGGPQRGRAVAGGGEGPAITRPSPSPETSVDWSLFESQPSTRNRQRDRARTLAEKAR